MLITSCLYLTITILCMFSGCLFYIVTKSKNKDTCYWTIIVGAYFIVYLFISLGLFGWLYIPFGFEILFVYFAEFVAGVLCITSIIISCIKMRKLINESKDRHMKYIVLACVILPIIPVSFGILDNYYTINHSDLILVYRSAGGGGFGETKYFAYGINDNSCKEFDLGINTGGYRISNFLPSNAKKTTLEDVSKYSIELSTDSLIVHKNGQQICSTKFLSHYSNNSLEKVFYITR